MNHSTPTRSYAVSPAPHRGSTASSSAFRVNASTAEGREGFDPAGFAVTGLPDKPGYDRPAESGS